MPYDAERFKRQMAEREARHAQWKIKPKRPVQGTLKPTKIIPAIPVWMMECGRGTTFEVRNANFDEQGYQRTLLRAHGDPRKVERVIDDDIPQSYNRGGQEIYVFGATDQVLEHLMRAKRCKLLRTTDADLQGLGRGRGRRRVRRRRR